MANLTFADTHNIVAFLSKSDTSIGFDQIVDFLNAQVIQYALMVNPTIYVSCIKQFWTTVSIKKVNNVVKLQDLIDKKKVITTEDVIQQVLRLDDADGMDCLSSEEILIELAHMGYEKPPPNAKRTAWNEFSCLMAFAVICLATEEEDEVEVPSAPTPTTTPSPPSPEPISPPPQAQPAPSSPPQNDNATIKDVSAAEPTVFDDDEVTVTMDQTLIKMKAKKARLLDEQMAQRLHDEEIKQAVAKEKQEKDDFEKAKVLQKQKYQSLKRKPISIAQAWKNMIVYLKNMVGYKMEQFKGMTYDK
nr:hypothetical protein [Tanacetum cinerariifolium]